MLQGLGNPKKYTNEHELTDHHSQCGGEVRITIGVGLQL